MTSIRESTEALIYYNYHHHDKNLSCNFNIHIKLSSSLFNHIFHYNVTILIPSLYLDFFFISIVLYCFKWLYIKMKIY